MKTTHMNSNIANKINKSDFMAEANTIIMLSYLIQKLIDNVKFNEILMKQIKEQNLSYLNKFLEKALNTKDTI